MTRSAITRIGAHPLGVWVVKHLVSPLDRMVVSLSGGRIPSLSSLVVPTLLPTTVGRHSGQERTTPLLYVRDGDRFIVANTRPAGERRNPWGSQPGNHRKRTGQGSGSEHRITADELGDPDADRWWSTLVEIWPAFAEHYRTSGDRTVYALHPIGEATADSSE